MNPTSYAYISKQVTEALSAQSEQISSAIYANVPKNVSQDELLPIVVGNILQFSITASVCMTLEFLKSAECIQLPDIREN